MPHGRYPTPTPSSGHHAAFIPDSLRGRADLGLRLKDAWPDFPQLVFIWTTYATYAAKAVGCAAAVTAHENVGLTRPQTTGTLKEINTKLDYGLECVKVYLKEKFGKEKA